MWALDYEVYSGNRLGVGKVGKTAYERARAKKATALGLEIGEALLYKVKPVDKIEKMKPRLAYRIFVGVRKRSGDLWVASPSGVVAARSAKRIRAEERCGKDC